MGKVIVTQSGSFILAERFSEYEAIPCEDGCVKVLANQDDYSVLLARVLSIKDGKLLLSMLAEFIATDETFGTSEDRIFDVSQQGVELLEQVQRICKVPSR